MAGLRPGVVAAVLRKDFISLWPLVLGALLLPLCLGAESVMMQRATVSLLKTFGGLATVALVLTLIHQDSSTGARHDWLTRPIGPLNLLAAKGIFLCLAVGLPMLIAYLVDERLHGHVWSEAIPASLALMTSGLLIIVPVVVLGLVTGSLIEAGVIGLSLAILGMTVTNTWHVRPDLSATRWVADVMSYVVVLIFCIAALALLFGRKNPFAARITFIGGAMMVYIVTNFFPVSAAQAIQQWVSPRSDVATKLVTKVSEPCAYNANFRLKAGVILDGLPEGWRVNVDHAWARSVDAGAKGSRKVAAYASREPIPMESRGWSLIIPAGPVASAKSVQWTYALTLLEPAISRDLPVDGRRRFLPGIGYCEASGRGRESVIVGCFKPFAQPAMMTAQIKGDDTSLCLTCGTLDYTPALLSGFGKSRRAITQSLPDGTSRNEPAVVTLKTYEARGHISRRSVTAAPSGATARVCPASSSEKART